MNWEQELELELEVAVADALEGGPATPSAAAAAERNMRVTIDRWFAQGRVPKDIGGYTLRVEGGKGLSVDLQFQKVKMTSEVVVDTVRKKSQG